MLGFGVSSHSRSKVPVEQHEFGPNGQRSSGKIRTEFLSKSFRHAARYRGFPRPVRDRIGFLLRLAVLVPSVSVRLGLSLGRRHFVPGMELTEVGLGGRGRARARFVRRRGD